MGRKVRACGLMAVTVILLVAGVVLCLPWNAWQKANGGLAKDLVGALGLRIAPSSSADALLPLSGFILFTSNRDARDPDLETLYMVRADGKETIQLTHIPSFEPELAPDGRQIVFAGDDGSGNFELYTVDLRDRRAKQLTELGTESRSPTWSPDSRRIAFETLDRQSKRLQLYVIDAGGGIPARLVDLPDGAQRPAWSPDGRMLAFISGGEIYVLHLESGRITQLTRNKMKEKDLSWSPDGRQIIFSGGLEDFELYTVEPEAQSQARLTATDLLEAYPAFSPDGARLVFMALSPDNHANIYVMDANGANLQQLTDNNARNALPIWSPGGRRVAFTSDMDGDPEIYVMDADGTNLIQLTHNEARDVAWAWLH